MYLKEKVKLTYTDILNEYTRGIGRSVTADTSIIASFQLNLAQRYQMILAEMQNYVTATQITDTTVAAQQYYAYPVGFVNIEDVVVTVGSFQYPMMIINNQHNWDVLNAINVQASAIPQFIFPRRDDYGIWPIPQDAYTITFNYHTRDRDLTVADYTAGTASFTNASTTITGSGTTWTAAMVGRWITMNDVTKKDQGYWYRITAFTSTTSITVSRKYMGATASTAAYRIGQVPEIPDEGHILLVDGTLADFYSSLRNDNETATWYNNKFWTGDGNNASRSVGDQTIRGGLIGLKNRYIDRNKQMIIERRPNLSPLTYQVWATTLS